MTKLTDTHLIMLSAASQRDDGLVIMPERLKGGAAKAVATKLMNLGLAQEAAVKGDQPSWRTSEEGGPVGLKITAAGLAVIGVDGESPPSSKTENAKQSQGSGNADKQPGSEPREGSKQAMIISLLRREEGATLRDLIEHTRWLPHTTRAALSGLRQKGYEIEKSRAEDGATLYKINASAGRSSRKKAA